MPEHKWIIKITDVIYSKLQKWRSYWYDVLFYLFRKNITASSFPFAPSQSLFTKNSPAILHCALAAFLSFLSYRGSSHTFFETCPQSFILLFPSIFFLPPLYPPFIAFGNWIGRKSFLLFLASTSTMPELPLLKHWLRFLNC